MPGTLAHSPADVLRCLLVDLGEATLPTASGSWPAHNAIEPDSPDAVITAYDTTGRKNGRVMNSGGEVQGLEGIQLRIRSRTKAVGWEKANDIMIALDNVSYRTVRILRSTTSYDYLITNVSRQSGIIHLGKEVPNSKRDIHVLNLLVNVRTQSTSPNNGGHEL